MRLSTPLSLHRKRNRNLPKRAREVQLRLPQGLQRQRQLPRQRRKQPLRPRQRTQALQRDKRVITSLSARTAPMKMRTSLSDKQKKPTTRSLSTNCRWVTAKSWSIPHCRLQSRRRTGSNGNAPHLSLTHGFSNGEFGSLSGAGPISRLPGKPGQNRPVPNNKTEASAWMPLFYSI